MSDVKNRNYFTWKTCIAKAINCDFQPKFVSPLLEKKTGTCVPVGVFIFRLPRLHTQLIMLIISIDFQQNLSSLRFSFDTLIGRSNTGVLPAILIKYRKEHYAKNAIISYVEEIELGRRDNLVERSSSACKQNHCKIQVHTVQIQNY